MTFQDGSELLCAPVNFNTHIAIALVRRIDGISAAVETFATMIVPATKQMQAALDEARQIGVDTIFADRVNGRLTGR